MTCIRGNVVNQEEFITRFGINGGLSVVRGLDYNKLMAMDIDRIKLLFQPSNARFIRQFGLETIVNSYGTKNQILFIHDLIDITELAISISCRQFKDRLLAKPLITEFRKRMNFRTAEAEVFLDILMDMFRNDELEVSITHPKQFDQLFNFVQTDDLLKVVTGFTKKLHIAEKISVVSLGMANGSVKAHFLGCIFPSIVRTINPCAMEGRRIRGLREINKHRKDILDKRLYEYTPEETKALISLLDKVANLANEKYSEEISC